MRCLNRGTVRAPDSDLQHLIEARLLAAYGDPRIRSTGVWSLISAGARRVSPPVACGGHHPGVLRYRDAGRPHAHVVGPQAPLDGPLRRWSHHASLVRTERCRGTSVAARLRNASKTRSRWRSAGTALQSSQDRNKCLLIINVQGRWVVEGSHSFPTWVFPSGDSDALVPYEDSYTCDQFRSHRGSGATRTHRAPG